MKTDRLLDALLRAVQLLAGTAFLAVFLVNLLRILLRNVLGINWFWIDGFSRLAFIWTVFLGATVEFGTTLLVKGLEFHHAVVLDADAYDARNLYVALTRGSISRTNQESAFGSYCTKVPSMVSNQAVLSGAMARDA